MVPSRERWLIMPYHETEGVTAAERCSLTTPHKLRTEARRRKPTERRPVVRRTTQTDGRGRQLHAVVRLHGLVTQPVVDQREPRGLGCGRCACGHLSLVIGLIVVPEGLTDAAIIAEGPFFITADPDTAACSAGPVLVPVQVQCNTERQNARRDSRLKRGSERGRVRCKR